MGVDNSKDDGFLEKPQGIVSASVEKEPGLPSASGSGIAVYDSLGRYLAEVRKYPFLTKEEEEVLTRRYQETKDPEAASSLVRANLRFVVTVAREYKNTNISMMDLIQEGNIGLMMAIKRFDPNKGVRVVTYASWWIRASILKYILNNWRLVKIGTTQNERKLFFKLRQEQSKLEAQGIDDTVSALQERFNVRENEIIDMQHRLEFKESSLDAGIGDEGEVVGSLIASDIATSEEQTAQKELSRLFLKQLKQYEKGLNDRDRYILRARILTSKPATLKELSDRYGISKERVRQLEVKIINNFRKYITAEIKGFDSLYRDMLLLGEHE